MVKKILLVIALFYALLLVVLYAVMGWLGVSMGLVVLLAILLHVLILRIRMHLARVNGKFDDEELITLVLLLKAPAEATLSEVQLRVKRALGIDNLEVHGPIEFPETLGRGQGFGVIKDGIAMSINMPRVRYTESGATFDDDAPQDFKDIIEAHGGWISFDYTENNDEAPFDEEKVFAHLGRLAAEFADGDTLAIYTPTYSYFRPWEDSFHESLRSGDPLCIFGPESYRRINRNMVSMSTDNEQLQLAMEKAREEFPKFQNAFLNASTKEKENFLAKMAFTDGEATEHMWVRVDAIEGDVLKGVLVNAPNELTNVSEGDSIELPISKLSDWVYPDGDDLRGNFTGPILMGE